MNEMKKIDILKYNSDAWDRCVRESDRWTIPVSEQEVVVYDNSYQQLEQDRQVAEKYGLRLKTVKGDMADLSRFQDAAFDFIFHPCSNCFSCQVMSVWREAFRVLKPGGTLVSGFTNPILFLFDRHLEREGIFHLQYEMPYSDVVSLSSQELEAITASGEALVFAHSLEELIGGQLIAGFKLTGFYEDD
jgi:ubiquinone/menaquinone biosynthesis C-methylase UbiE